MNRFGKVISFALVTTMVLGSSFTSFATDVSGEQIATGRGSTEGHVGAPVLDVTLPTQAEGAFDYIMDPERLISATGHARYPYTVWPDVEAGEPDTGVYFYQGKVGDEVDSFKKYGSTSIKTTVTNKSRTAIDITVKAERVVDDDHINDIDLVADLENVDEASLYLALEYDDKDEIPDSPIAILNETAAEKTVYVEGTPENYTIDIKNNSYVYRMKTLSEWAAGNEELDQDDFDDSWKSLDFNLAGAVTEGFTVDAEQTAPLIKVTWSWADAANRHSVTFDTNGGSNIETQRVPHNGKATVPTDPTRIADANYNYRFAGWVKADGETEFDFDEEVISEDTTVYAKWDSYEYIVIETVSLGYRESENSIVLEPTPGFRKEAVIQSVKVNDTLIDTGLRITTNGKFVIDEAGFDTSADIFEVRAIIDGVGYTATVIKN